MSAVDDMMAKLDEVNRLADAIARESHKNARLVLYGFAALWALLLGSMVAAAWLILLH